MSVPCRNSTGDTGNNAPRAFERFADERAVPEPRGRLIELGADIFMLSPEEFTKFIPLEIERWKSVVAKANIRIDP